jgi:Ca-activated chloride channel homolog
MRFQRDTSRAAVIYLLACAAVLVASPRSSLAQQRGGAFAPAPPLKGPEDKAIAISTDLVSLQVSVTDKKGRFAPGLDRGAFAVYEDGVRQEISFFSDKDAPAAVGVVLDVSASMTGAKIRRAREALRRFIQTSHEEDEYFLIGFNQHPQLLLDGVGGSEAMAAHISGMEPQGATALYDAVAFGLG